MRDAAGGQGGAGWGPEWESLARPGRNSKHIYPAGNTEPVCTGFG